MTDLKARLAALPPMPNPAWDGDYETAYLALSARNALLREALREHACGETACRFSINDYCTCDLRAILAACEQKS
jgi:hypothetical protein